MGTASQSALIQGGVPISGVMVGDLPLVEDSSDIVLVRTRFRVEEHEFCTISVKAAATDLSQFVDGLISFRFGRGSNQSIFRGYVMEVAPVDSSTDGGKTSEVTCLGASMPLQYGRPRFWTDRTASSALSEVVAEHGLASHTDDSEYVWPSLAQVGESDWAFLKELARRSGFLLDTRLGTVRFHDPLRLLSEGVPARRLVMGDDDLPAPYTLIDFAPKELTNHSRELAPPWYGVEGGWTDGSRIRGELPSVSSTVPSFSVRSLAEATHLRDSWTRTRSTWKQTATARIQGDATIQVGDVVVVQTGVSLTRDLTYDGSWLVVGVEHHLSDKGFQTGLSLVRDNKRRPTNAVLQSQWSTARPTSSLRVWDGGDYPVWVSSAASIPKSRD